MRAAAAALAVFALAAIASSAALASSGTACGTAGQVRLGKHLEILEDPDGTLTYEKVSSPVFAGKFMKSRWDSPSFGFIKSVYWARFTADRDMISGNDLLLELDYPLMDKIWLYEPRPGGGYGVRKAGYDYPFAEREINYRNPVFSLKLPQGEKRTYYIRFENRDRMEFPLIIWQPRAFQDKKMTELFILGSYFGVIAVMFIYNLFLFFSIKEKVYLYYVIYVLGMGIFEWTQNGVMYQFLWPDSLRGMNHYIPYLIPVIAVSFILFTRSFLTTAEKYRTIDRAMLAMMGFFGLTFIAAPFMRYGTVINIQAVAVTVSLAAAIAASVMIVRRKFAPAKYYLLAFSFFLLGALIFSLKVIAMVPINFFTAYSMQIGSAAEAALFSLGLGYRFNVMKDEALRSERRALEIQTRMSESFARFVPKEFLNHLGRESIVDIRLGDQVLRDMAVLFSDIRSFTTISEAMTPEENIDFLNSYLMSIGPIIRKNGGFIDKYIGDAIMALFPDSPDRAVQAALDMRRGLEDFNRLREISGQAAISIGIGIHYGTLVLGTIGEENRIETTVISDAVNIASRLEGLTKKIAAPVIISREVFRNLSDPGRFVVKRIGRVTVKGKTAPLEIMEVRGMQSMEGAAS